jgi:hypothetical protein
VRRPSNRLVAVVLQKCVRVELLHERETG